MSDANKSESSDKYDDEVSRKRRSPDYDEEDDDNEQTQSGSSSNTAETGGGDDNSSRAIMDCPICLQHCVHPVELPCSHIFCFLCIKGVAMQGNSRCAICRSAIPHDVLTNPRLKDVSQLYNIVPSDKTYHWFYEARSGGWWMYDERTMAELERNYNSSQPSCQLLIAGHLYDIDFRNMLQRRVNNANLFRRIKRDLASAEKRGIAGIRLNPNGSFKGGTQAVTTNNIACSVSTDISSSSTSTVVTTAGGGSTVNIGTSTRVPLSGPNATKMCPCGTVSDTLDRPLVDPEVILLSSSDDEGVEEEENYSDDEDEEMDDLAAQDENVVGSSSGEEEPELRDGARAPTRRSDRSSSSNNQSPLLATNSSTSTSSPTAVRPESSGCQNNTARSRASYCSSSSNGGSRGASPAIATVSVSGGGPVSVVQLLNNGNGTATTTTVVTPGSSVSNNGDSRNGSVTEITSENSVSCIIIGPGVRITVDRQQGSDEIL